MLRETDYLASKSTLSVLRQYKEDLKEPKILKWLLIIEFATSEIMRIFFRDGKPKNRLQLILSLPSIIGFARKLLEKINGETQKKNPPLEQKVDDAIQRSQTNSRLKR